LIRDALALLLPHAECKAMFRKGSGPQKIMLQRNKRFAIVQCNRGEKVTPRS